MKYNFNEVIERHGTNSMKWDMTEEMIRENGMGETLPDNAIFINTADMDFKSPPCIPKALQKIVDFNLYGYYYLDSRISREYYDALINWNKRRYHYCFSAEDIIYIDGTINAVTIAVKALTKPTDKVLISPPIYSPFFAIVEEIAKRKLVTSPLINTNMYYTFDWDDIEEKVRNPEVKAYLLCSPQNPTGRVWTDEELIRLYDLCTANNVVVISDEIHGDLTRKSQLFHPIGSLVSGDNLVVCSGANKTFNIAALHASHMIVTNPQLRERIQTELDWNAPNPFTVAATTAVYNEAEDWLEALREYLDGNLDYAVKFLHERMPKVKVRLPEGTYILWMDFRDYGLLWKELQERIFTVAGIVAEGGPDFDRENGEGFVRFCLASPRATVEEVFHRLETAFADI